MEVFVCAFLKASGFVKAPPQKRDFRKGDFRRGILKADDTKKQGGLHHAAHATHSAHAAHIRHCWGRFFFFDFMHGGFCG